MKRQHWGVVLTLMAAMAFAFLISCPLPNQRDRSPVVAQVGEETLTLQEILTDLAVGEGDEIAPMDIKQYVFRWIDSEVLYQEALARNFDESAELEETLARIKRELVINNLIDHTLNQETQISEEEVRAYYDSNKVEFVLPVDQVRALYIVIDNAQKANELRQRLRRGESFETLMQEVRGDSSWVDSGDTGFFAEAEMAPAIAGVAFNLPIGAASRPIKTDLGYYLIKLVDRVKKGEPHRFEEVRDRIRAKLLAEKQEENYQRFLLQTKSKFKVATRFEVLSALERDSLAIGRR